MYSITHVSDLLWFSSPSKTAKTSTVFISSLVKNVLSIGAAAIPPGTIAIIPASNLPSFESTSLTTQLV